jgi:hypothetical protein
MADSQRAVLASRCVGALLDSQSYITPDERGYVGDRIIRRWRSWVDTTSYPLRIESFTSLSTWLVG